MGVGLKNLIHLAWLFDQGFVPARGSVLELGSQNIQAAGFEDQFEQIIDVLAARAGMKCDREAARAIAAGGKMSRFLALCGCEYHALDIFEDDQVTLFDLNLHDLPHSFHDRFDLVTNFGTTEHVFDQVRCFRTMHDAAKVGGVIYSDVPMGGYLYHGYFLYTPMFFEHLALANDYEVVFDYYGVSPIETAASEEMRKGGYEQPSYHDAGVEFAFRKKIAAPFRLPLEIGTSSIGITNDVWNGAPPYRVIKGALEARALKGSQSNRAQMRRDWLVELARRVDVLSTQWATIADETASLRSELRSFKSYFNFARPFARLLRRNFTTHQ